MASPPQKTIVIGDIHQNIAMVDAILTKEKYADEVVFLGDWFDSFLNPPAAASFEVTCTYLRHLVLSHPLRNKFIFLLGNHDIGYIYHNDRSSLQPIGHTDCYFCSGFTPDKARIFRKIFFEEGLRDEFFLAYFKAAHYTQGISLSHAGLHSSHLLEGESPQTLINTRLPEIWKKFRRPRTPGNWLLSAAGRARQGESPVGGLLWLDWYLEFSAQASTGLQIVGHTHLHEPSCRAMGTGHESWNIDTGKDYAIIRNGRVTTVRVSTPPVNPL
jgi:hypothetical protein